MQSDHDPIFFKFQQSGSLVQSSGIPTNLAQVSDATPRTWYMLLSTLLMWKYRSPIRSLRLVIHKAMNIATTDPAPFTNWIIPALIPR
eukprot:7460742-Karenia_brevis.AAC.1